MGGGGGGEVEGDGILLFLIYWGDTIHNFLLGRGGGDLSFFLIPFFCLAFCFAL